MTETYSLEQAKALLTDPGAPFAMEAMTIAGRSVRIWKNAPPTLRAILQNSREFGDRIYWVYENERISYAEHYQLVARLATALARDYDIRPGDRIAITMRNYSEWVIAFWATVSIGAIAVPLNAWWSGAELEYGLQDSGAVLLFADSERIERIVPFLPKLNLRAVIAVRSDDTDSNYTETFASVMAKVDANAPLPEVAVQPEDDATIFYTSGTTGKPKGALGTHRNICVNPFSISYIQSLMDLCSGQTPDVFKEVRPHQICLLTVPLFHVTGCHAVLLGTTMAGNTLVSMYKWDPEHALELIEREQITTFTGVPGMVWQVLESSDYAKRDTSSLAVMAYGGAPAAPQLHSRIKQAGTEIAPRNGYGMTEMSALFSGIGGLPYQQKPDSVGPLAAICDARIVGSNGQDVPTGEIGELWGSGSNIVKGYWNKPEANAETFTKDGWLRTGDLARLDEDGFLYIVDRAKDMLIRGGENVYCVEVEDALYSHPAVMDASVIGLPDRILGEQVAAVVQIKPDAAATEVELKQHVAERLAAFKVPVKIDLRNAPLPRNANGKIMKQQLKSEMIEAAQL